MAAGAGAGAAVTPRTGSAAVAWTAPVSACARSTQGQATGGAASAIGAAVVPAGAWTVVACSLAQSSAPRRASLPQTVRWTGPAGQPRSVTVTRCPTVSG
ncbi:hypothetical protein, partial [Micromonospora sp. M42]|uniref:hypothetical protein n=1 Tax=Micromonospora sp. M42 TaxID=457406 RepID=UPI001CB79592